MELINTSNGQFQDADPATLTPGTMISASWANNIQGEIAAVITDRGGTLDGTKTNQMSTILFNTMNGYLPLTGGTITGTLNVVTVGNGDNSNNAASTAYVKNNLSSYVSTFGDSNTYTVSQVGYQHTNDYISFNTSNGWILGATQSWTNNQISNEANVRANAVGTLTSNLNAEISRATATESTLQGNINTETTARENADALLLPRTGGTITGNLVVNGSMDRDGPISDVPGVTGTAVPNTSWVDTNYVSSTRYMVSGDSACDGLHYSSGATAPWFHSGSWSGSLATQDWSNGIFQAASDFAGSTETCINLPCGIRIQTWSINLVTSSAQARVNFPVAFSAGPSCVLVTSSAGDMDTWTTAWDSSGFTMHVPSDSQIQNGNVSILAVGPK